MDSRLKLLLEGDPEERLMLLVRLKDASVQISFATIIAKFEDIVSCRVKRKNLMEMYNSPNIISIKAPRVIFSQLESSETAPIIIVDGQERVSRKVQNDYSGKGVYFAAIDWGFDFAHDNFRNADGTTRFAYIWDQNGVYDQNNYGYGRIYSRKAINRALNTNSPYAALGYHPGRRNSSSVGMHGTHVMDIAAGASAVGEGGVAPEAMLVGIELGSNQVNGSDIALGDSVHVVEALHFIYAVTKGFPCVINMSLGSHGDSHTGKSLAEIAIDNLVANNQGIAVVQSVGNYFLSHCHIQHNIKQGETFNIEWNIPRRNPTPNEMEIWYQGSDELYLRILNPVGFVVSSVEPFDDVQIKYNGTPLGYVFQREKEPNTGLNHINIIIDANTEKGKWIVQLYGEKIKNGLLHAYSERNDFGQARFSPSQSTGLSTTGSVCNSENSITVGAYNHYDLMRKMVDFSSSGPTIFGQPKPDLLAPGYEILAAKSPPIHAAQPINGLTKKSGSSMAAPHVSGALLLLFQKCLPELLPIAKTKEILFRSVDAVSANFPEQDKIRAGKGYLNIKKMLLTPEKGQNSTKLSIGIMEEIMHESDLHQYCQHCGALIQRAHAHRSVEASHRNELEQLATTFLGEDSFLPYDIYQHFHTRYPTKSSAYNNNFVAIAIPGKFLRDGLQVGDLVLTRNILADKTTQAIIAEPQLRMVSARSHPQSNFRRSGYFIKVLGRVNGLEKDSFMRVADSKQRVLENIIILRKNDLNTDDSKSEDKSFFEDQNPTFCTANNTFVTEATLRLQIVNQVSLEYNWWRKGPSGKQILESTVEGMARIGSYWKDIPSPPEHTIPGTAWSAVFVSSCIKRASNLLNLNPVPLMLSSGHFHYAKSAYNKRFNSPSQPGYYWAFDPATRPVQIGDIIVKERLQPNNQYLVLAFTTFSKYSGASCHGDIVVQIDKSSNYAVVIGGNLSDSVNQTQYQLAPNGTILNSSSNNDANRVFAILSLEPQLACTATPKNLSKSKGASPVIPTPKINPLSFDALKVEYNDLFDTCKVNQDKLPEVDKIIGKILKNQVRYESVGKTHSIPWYFIAVIHNMESSLNFNTHLHNGDPLTARTVHVPAGKPVNGNPPFTWEFSAEDALVSHNIHKVKNWNKARILYELERYNGWGYRKYHPHVKSSYLWSFSNHYSKGKYIADGKWSETTVSKNAGSAVILKRMVETGQLTLS
jgi:lysozyme family protein/subtilisin family serine protease